MRVVSLLPSATELLTALGVDPVGISHSCDYPPHVTDRPVLTSTDIDYEDQSSSDIDDQMQSVQGAVYDLDGDELESLDPDIVVTQATCDICAVDSSAVFETVESRSLDTDVLALDPHSFEDVLDDIVAVGAAVDKRAEAEALRVDAADRVADIRSRGGRLDRSERPRTAVLDWTDPLIRGGHWVRDMVRLAGGDESFQPEGASAPIRWETLLEYDPERLVVAPCGFDVERALEAVSELSHHPMWDDIAAVQSGHVYAVDGNALVNRPGPRLVDSLAVFADCIHPDSSSGEHDQWFERVEAPLNAR
ncbi:Fe3+-hydroxamate ABC transporter substrate-binding protein [Haloferax mucosum ATCC BAA-1512]|uniref:Fe3+-hydroxamate ABC transporter substrate-binding protein n=1 Tax=Haloferax mucosum ATCC BAA-1512 TaxID=662479 RepID=M0IN43_9EURY|nr:ABC transporter substrate-binding protein [Haloferax mucosum]ELZ98140.1 Fe3+-hydroxamate ABC transporter substrate-binding protein [Haloferax mucosum ATCC BAA-1512]